MKISSETVRTLSRYQLAELKKLFAVNEIIQLGRIDEGGRLIVEYEETIWLTDDGEAWHKPPKKMLKTIVINYNQPLLTNTDNTNKTAEHS